MPATPPPTGRALPKKEDAAPKKESPSLEELGRDWLNASSVSSSLSTYEVLGEEGEEENEGEVVFDAYAPALEESAAEVLDPEEIVEVTADELVETTSPDELIQHMQSLPRAAPTSNHPAAKSKSGLVIGGALVGVLALGGGAFAIFGGGEEEVAAAPPPAPVEAPPAEPAPVRPPPPPESTVDNPTPVVTLAPEEGGRVATRMELGLPGDKGGCEPLATLSREEVGRLAVCYEIDKPPRGTAVVKWSHEGATVRRSLQKIPGVRRLRGRGEVFLPDDAAGSWKAELLVGERSFGEVTFQVTP